MPRSTKLSSKSTKTLLALIIVLVVVVGGVAAVYVAPSLLPKATMVGGQLGILNLITGQIIDITPKHNILAPLVGVTVNNQPVTINQLVYAEAWLVVNPTSTGTLQQVHFTLQIVQDGTQLIQAGTESVSPIGFPQTLSTESFIAPAGTCGKCVFPSGAVNSVSTWTGALTASNNNVVALFYRDRTTAYDVGSTLIGWAASGFTYRNMAVFFGSSFTALSIGTHVYVCTWTVTSITWQPTGGASTVVPLTASNVFSATFNVVVSSDASVTVTVAGSTS